MTEPRTVLDPYETPSLSAHPGAVGELRMEFATRDGRTYIPSQYNRGALKIFRPLYLADDGEATVTIVNPGGGYLGGDRYEVDIALQAGAVATVTSQGANRIYRTEDQPAVQVTRIRLDEGACLTWAPDELIGYADANYRQISEAIVHPGATLLTEEIVTPGWSPDGERFRYAQLHTIFDVRSLEGRLLARDNLLLEPGVFGVDDEAGPLGPGCTHVGSVFVVSPHVTEQTIADVRELIADLTGGNPPNGDLRAGVSMLPTPGLMMRGLSTETGALKDLNAAVLNYLRGEWFSLTPLALRKY